MRFLLDTHSLLWFLSGHPNLSERARLKIESPDSEIWASVASLWEIAIKHSIGKLHLARAFQEIFPAQLAANSIEILSIRPEHLAVVAQMPFHHRDPFDRLIAAQALIEKVPLLSSDDVLDSYGIERLW